MLKEQSMTKTAVINTNKFSVSPQEILIVISKKRREIRERAPGSGIELPIKGNKNYLTHFSKDCK